MIFDPGPESYYGPTFWWQCPVCKDDRTVFPGRE
jgi:lipopolysaccharide biosynthesis regulator YciM